MKILKLTFKLVSIAIGMTLLLSLVYAVTKGNIEKEQEKAVMRGLSVALPGYSIDKNVKKLNDFDYWTGTKENENGYIVKTESSGYSSTISLLAGIDISGKIIGIYILSQAETPGLGARLTEVASDKYIWESGKEKKSEKEEEPWFSKQFKGINITERIKLDTSTEYHSLNRDDQDSYRDNNRITGISGATISTTAVIKSLEKISDKFINELRTTVSEKKKIAKLKKMSSPEGETDGEE